MLFRPLFCPAVDPSLDRGGSNITAQPVYICDNIHKVFLDKQGYIAANILREGYPEPMNVSHTSNSTVCVATTQKIQSYTSGLMLPHRPGKIAFELVKENIYQLKNHQRTIRKQYHKQNTPLFPYLRPPTTKISLQPNTIPKARYTPIPAPHYQKVDVIAALDREVTQSVI